jgi:hypothetical protein
VHGGHSSTHRVPWCPSQGPVHFVVMDTEMAAWRGSAQVTVRTRVMLSLPSANSN